MGLLCGLKARRWEIRLKKITLIFCICICALIAGCSTKKNDREKIRDIEFTVVADEDVPEELKTLIEEKKQSELKMTYKTEEYLYIVRGYGEQKTGGYSIAVNECYLTSNAVYFKTNLIGPDKTTEIPEAASYPYVVLKMEDLDKAVVFQ